MPLPYHRRRLRELEANITRYADEVRRREIELADAEKGPFDELKKYKTEELKKARARLSAEQAIYKKEFLSSDEPQDVSTHTPSVRIEKKAGIFSFSKPRDPLDTPSMYEGEEPADGIRFVPLRTFLYDVIYAYTPYGGTLRESWRHFWPCVVYLAAIYILCNDFLF